MRQIPLYLICLFITHFSFAQEQTKPAESFPPVPSEKALESLMEGNARFVSGTPRHPHEARNWRNQLEGGQHPFAVILGCSDSRVPPELVFDQGFGDVFVIRVAGNVVDTDVIASVEYAIDHLDTKLIVVMGHSDCGAISATVDHYFDIGVEPAEVVSLLYQIEPAVMGFSSDLPREEMIPKVIDKNIDLGVRRLSRVPDVRRRLKISDIQIVGAIYDIHSGKVEILED